MRSAVAASASFRPDGAKGAPSAWGRFSSRLTLAVTSVRSLEPGSTRHSEPSRIARNSLKIKSRMLLYPAQISSPLPDALPSHSIRPQGIDCGAAATWSSLMTSAVPQELHRVRLLSLAADGPRLRTSRDATDVMSEGLAPSAFWIATPVSRPADDFFRLRAGVAGEVVSKLVGYAMNAAFLGGVSQRVATSDSFRDFVREANRGRDLGLSPISKNSAKRLGKAQSRAAAPGGRIVTPHRRGAAEHTPRERASGKFAVQVKWSGLRRKP